jgi:hypothetical protein
MQFGEGGVHWAGALSRRERSSRNYSIERLCLRLCPQLATTVPHEVAQRVSSNLRSEQQVQEITRDSRRELVALTGIEPVFED